MHRVGDAVHYFSRARNEHGEMSNYSVFDRVVRDALTQERVILDCEIVVWNKTRRASPKTIAGHQAWALEADSGVSDAAPLGLRHHNLVDLSCALYIATGREAEAQPRTANLLGLFRLTRRESDLCLWAWLCWL